MRLSAVHQRSVRLVLLGAIGLTGGGCEKPAQHTSASAPASAAATPIAPTSAPATAPFVASHASPSVLLIGEREVSFPPGRFIIEATRPKLALLVFSDNAPSPGAENRYSLRLEIDAENMADLNGADLVQQAPDMQRQDTLDGIYLTGEKKLLQPYNLRAAFALRGGILTLKFDSYFLEFETDDEDVPAKLVRVRATLGGKLEVEEAEAP